MKQLIAILGTFCALTTLSAEVKVAPSLTPIYEEILECNNGTLFLIDVGGTLLIHKDPVLHTSHEKWKAEWFQEHYPNLTLEEKIPLIRAVETDKRCWVLSAAWPDLIEKAQERQIKSIAFTKCLIHPSLVNLRLDWLKSFGLDFHDDLNELPYQNDLFIYTNGVIQTGQKLKGPVLKEVLSKLKERPLKIVFVDDRLEQVKSVEEACKEMNIPFVGFHYTAFEASPSLDEAIANKQLEILAKEHRWVSHEDLTPATQNTE